MVALGDIAERILRLFGITKERVQAITGKPCGCKKRQDAMNAWGYRVQQRMAVPLAWFINRWQFVECSQAVYRFREAFRHFAIGFRVLFTGRH